MRKLIGVDIGYASDRVFSAVADLADAAISRTNLGVSFFDDALFGILPTDLILIGAKTGVGKTQICLTIAAEAALTGKRVCLIALEAEPREVEKRLLYTLEMQLYFQDKERYPSEQVNYRFWRFGQMDLVLEKYRAKALEIFREKYKNLITVYREENFDFMQLLDVLDVAKEEGCELVVLDHFSYIDIQDSKYIYEEQARLIKRIRTLNVSSEIPFVVACHVKKKIDNLIPGLDEFEGSGAIAKNCTVAIILQPLPDGYDHVNKVSATIASIPKMRTGGMGSVVGLLDYSIKYQSYSPYYSLAKVINKSVEKIPLEEYPDWAKKPSR